MAGDWREARFAVGAKNSLKSTIWKVWTQGDEAYILNRITEKELKVSLHSSGQCQWSCTDAWVIRTSASRNAERHIVRWQIVPPIDNEAVMAFRVLIPISELRPSEAPVDRKKVFWISGAPAESTIQILFYLTKASKNDPVTGSILPRQHLFSLKFRNNRWLVALIDQISLSQADLRAAREAAKTQAFTSNLTLNAAHRIHLFIQPREGAPAGLLELCGTECVESS